MTLYHILLRKTFNPLKWKCFKIVCLGTNTSNALQTRWVTFCGGHWASSTFPFPGLLGTAPLSSSWAWLSDLPGQWDYVKAEALKSSGAKGPRWPLQRGSFVSPPPWMRTPKTRVPKGYERVARCEQERIVPLETTGFWGQQNLPHILLTTHFEEAIN